VTVIGYYASFFLQTVLALGASPVDTTRALAPVPGIAGLHRPVATTIRYLRFDDLQIAPRPDTVRRQRGAIKYSETYNTRLKIHKALSFAMIPLFIGAAYTGFELRNKKDQAPKWTRDLHGPLAGGTAVVFGMNTLTGLWNLIEGRKDPEGRSKRILHGALFLAAAAGFTYVTVAGDDIRSTGHSNHWHRDIALGSMGVSLISWGLMTF
jgi:hypothetical protein